MKKLLSLLLFAGVLAACDKIEAPENLADLEIPEVKLSYNDKSNKQEVSFVAPEAWSVDIADAKRAVPWLSVNPMSGPAGKATVTITTAENNTGADPRSAEVTITSGEISKTFTVTQHSETSQNEENGGDTEKYIRGMESTYTVDSEAQTLHIDVVSNFAFTVTEMYGSGDQGGWLTSTISSPKQGTYSVDLAIQANGTGAERTATVWFADGDGKSYCHTVVVQSAAGGGDTDKYVQVNHFGTSSAAAQTVTISVTSNFQFLIGTQVYAGGDGWFQVQTTPPASGSDVYTVKVAITANETTENRVLELQFKDDKGNIYNVAKIEQEKGREPDPQPTFYITFLESSPEDIPLAGGTMNVRFSVSDPQATVTCSSAYGWISVGNPSRETSTGNTYTVAVQCGPSSAVRKGEFVITAVLNGVTATRNVGVSQVP